MTTSVSKLRDWGVVLAPLPFLLGLAVAGSLLPHLGKDWNLLIAVSLLACLIWNYLPPVAKAWARLRAVKAAK